MVFALQDLYVSSRQGEAVKIICIYLCRCHTGTNMFCKPVLDALPHQNNSASFDV